MDNKTRITDQKIALENAYGFLNHAQVELTHEVECGTGRIGEALISIMAASNIIESVLT